MVQWGGWGGKTRCWTYSDGKQKKKKKDTLHMEIWKSVIFGSNYTADIPAAISSEPHKLLVKA